MFERTRRNRLERAYEALGKRGGVAGLTVKLVTFAELYIKIHKN